MIKILAPERLCFVVGCNNEHSSRQLLLTSEPLKRIVFVLKGVRLPICLNASMFARIIHDPASLTAEVNIRFFYESLQIAFLNNVLVIQSLDECGYN